jgi:hypothetical protein
MYFLLFSVNYFAIDAAKVRKKRHWAKDFISFFIKADDIENDGLHGH